MTMYAYVGNASRELLSYRGAILVHDNPAEMEYLIPGYAVIPLPPAEALGRPTMPLRHHPDLAAVAWPLEKGSFRDR